jgi:hypothetical protein
MHEGVRYALITREASPRIAKSVGKPNGPCGFLSASSRRGLPVCVGGPSPSAAPNRAT